MRAWREMADEGHGRGWRGKAPPNRRRPTYLYVVLGILVEIGLSLVVVLVFQRVVKR